MGVLDCSSGEGVERDYSEAEQAQIAATPGSSDLLKVERDRRLACGFDFDFGDPRGVHRIGTTKEDREGWDEVTTAAQTAVLLGEPGLEIQIKTDTGPTTVTAVEWLQVLAAAGTFRQPVWQAYFVLKGGEIPADFADDSHWPPAA
jgi:hypothetical protein